MFCALCEKITDQKASAEEGGQFSTSAFIKITLLCLQDSRAKFRAREIPSVQKTVHEAKDMAEEKLEYEQQKKLNLT